MELTEIARDVCERCTIRPSARARRSSCAPHGTVHGEWDPVRLDQVFTNLLTNAIKYGGGKPIEVSIAAETAEGPEAVIRVRDRGMGIARENHARIFERFERAVVRSQ